MATPRKATSSASSAASAAANPALATSTGLIPTTASNGSSKADKESDAAAGSSVQVVVRCRPANDKEKASGDSLVVGCYPAQSEVRVISKKGMLAASAPGTKASASDSKTYTFDATYGALSTQDEVYNNTVKPLVEEVLGGFNCTVLAYGQTGTGKTHTMEGELAATVTPNSGVIPRAVHSIFESLATNNYEDYSVKVSFLELYNEELADLLAEYEERPASSSSMSGGSSSSSASSSSAANGSAGGSGSDNGPKELRIFEDPSGKKGMQVLNLEEVIVSSATDVFALLAKANKRRRVAETLMNARSSRSHYVFTISVSSKLFTDDGEDVIKTGKLYLVDLAGSECVGSSGAKGIRAKEAGKINQSLLTLGRVINALVDRASFVPYRDSKLTRLLQESLGGRAKTVIIATCSPCVSAFDETISTLDYAHRAKNIKNKPQKSVTLSKRAYMKELLAEIASLKRDNEVLRTKNGIIVAPEKYERMLSEEKGKSMQIDELLFKIKSQQDSLDAVQLSLSAKEALLTAALESKASTEATLASTVEMLESTRVTLTESRAHLLSSQELLVAFQRALFVREAELSASRSLVDAQRATEYRLTSQALQVLSALETTLDAKEALHAKVERKAVVEEHNASAAQKFQNRIQSNIETVEQQDAALATQTHEQLLATQSSIASQSAARASRVQELASGEESAHASLIEQNASMRSTVTTFAAEHARALQESSSTAASFHQGCDQAFAQAASASAANFATLASQADSIKQASSAAHVAAQQEASAVVQSSTLFVASQLVPALRAVESAAVAHSNHSVAASTQASTVLTSFAKAQHKRVAGDAQSLQERIAAIQAANNERVAAVAAANAARVAELAAANAKAVADMHAQQTAAAEASAQRIASMQTEQAAAFAKLQTEQSARLTALQQEHAERVRKALEEQASSVAAMQADMKTSSLALQTAHAEQVRLAQQEHSVLVSSMQATMVAEASARQAELVQSSAALQADLVASVAALQQVLVAEVDSLVSQARDGQIDLVERNVQDVVGQVEGIINKEQEAIAQLQTGVKELDATSQTFVQTLTTRAESVAAGAEEAHAKLAKDQAALASDITRCGTEAAEATASFRAANSARQAVAESENASTAALAVTFAKAQSEAIDAVVQSIDASHARVGAWVASVGQEDSAAQKDLSSRAADLSATLSAHAASSAASSASARSIVSTYISAELRRDVPLGTTPQKGAPGPVYPSRSALARTASAEEVFAAHRSSVSAPTFELKGMVHSLEGVDELVAADLAQAEEQARAQAQADAVTLAEAKAASRAAALALEAEAASASPKNHAAVVPMAALESVVAIAEPISAPTVAVVAEAAVDQEDAENAKPVALAAPVSPVASADIAVVEKPVAAAVAAPVVAAAAAPAPAPATHKRQLSAPKINVSAALADKTSAAAGGANAKATIPSTRASSRLRAPAGGQ